MRKWYGTAAVCLNENNEVLMVKSHDSDAWAVPSGGIEEGETPEECCVREVMEETGYEVKITDHLFMKETMIKGIEVKTHYFKVDKIGKSRGIDDPDKIIELAEWMSLSHVEDMKHVYPEDKKFLLEVMKS
ncbi:NUDIX hydrolase [Jeotgalibacillus salarius]|uniref:NUDIX hydrolase n=1 Tax=Jeotgalibacillus salarius TaxID=546023 RepID=A0A4Y8LD04_9BACL|nr:NUDIX hydrolase [Jeotgalibacillus salarius]TFE00564.1 NUDIX hydrolase [Jeotgalibacillus salarius]